MSIIVVTSRQTKPNDEKRRAEYFWIMTDNWRRLEFMVLRTFKAGVKYRPFVLAGTLTRI